MAIPSVLDRRVGYAKETTYGTAVTVTRFVPMVSTAILGDGPDRVESQGQVAGKLLIGSDQWQAGNKTWSGSVQHELYDHGVGFLFKQMFGKVATSGEDPYTHVFTLDDLTGESLTMQIGIPDIAGTVRPYTYAGVKVSSWEMAFAQGENVTLGLDVVAKSMVTDVALATASYPAALKPFHFKQAAIEIGGAAASVKNLTLSANLGLNTDRRFLGLDEIAEPLQSQRVEVTGTVTVEFASLAEHNRFLTGTEHALQAELTAGSNTCTIDANIRYDGGTPSDSGGLYEQAIPFKIVDDGTDSIKATIVNSDATP